METNSQTRRVYYFVAGVDHLSNNLIVGATAGTTSGAAMMGGCRVDAEDVACRACDCCQRGLSGHLKVISRNTPGADHRSARNQSADTVLGGSGTFLWTSVTTTRYSTERKDKRYWSLTGVDIEWSRAKLRGFCFVVTMLSTSINEVTQRWAWWVY